MNRRIVLYSFLISGVLISTLVSTIIYIPVKSGLHAQANPTDNRRQMQAVASQTAEFALLQQTIDAQMNPLNTPTARLTGSKDQPFNNPCTGQPFTTIMTGAGIASAQASISSYGDNIFVVNFTLADNDEAHRFSEYTATHIGQPLAIVLDGQVLSAPIVQAQLTTGGQITGNFLRDEAETLALQLRYGALPVQLTVESVETTKTGLKVIFSANFSGVKTDKERLEQAQSIIEQRLDALGVVGAKIQIDKANHLVIDLPKVKDSQLVIDTIQRTALVEFVDFSAACGEQMPISGQYIVTDKQLAVSGTPAK
jgi:preprotein translocase subunit SecD